MEISRVSPNGPTGLATPEADGDPTHSTDATLSPLKKALAPTQVAGDTLHRDTGQTFASPSVPIPAATDYEILQVLGRGGMGVVYKARQIGLNRLVALKMVQGSDSSNLEGRLRFQIEAESVAQMRHPNIVQVFEVGMRDGNPFLAIELLEGGTLQERLEKDIPAPVEAAQMLRPLAQAIHYAHQRGIIHRDLKPANILFSDAGVPKIVDFGLAKRLNAQQNQTQDGEVLGTPANMAPEQALGQSKKIGPATDIYALGTILYQLLTGKPALYGETVSETLTKIRDQMPEPPRLHNPRIPRDLETICLKCLQKAPEKRYLTAQDLADDLDRYLQGKPIKARPVSASERAWMWMKRHPAQAAVIFLTCLLMASAYGWVWSQWREAEEDRLSLIEQRKQERLKQAGNFILFISELRDVYEKDVVSRLERHGIQKGSENQAQETAIPNWSTFMNDLAQRVGRKKTGHVTRIFSDYPFPWQTDNGPKDDFDRLALQAVRQHPEKPFYRFEIIEGRPSLRYAAADVMLKACVQYHNTHPLSSKKDWKVGDVRGVLEVTLSLEQ